MEFWQWSSLALLGGPLKEASFDIEIDEAEKDALRTDLVDNAGSMYSLLALLIVIFVKVMNMMSHKV